MESIIARWLLEQDVAQLQRLAVDGKVLRGTGREDGKTLALLSIATHYLHTTLRFVPIAEKSNEIPGIKPLLEGLSIEGSLLSADAMHCQQKTAPLTTQDHGADYLFGLKGNQSVIFERATTKLNGFFFRPRVTPRAIKGTANSCAAASKPSPPLLRTSGSRGVGASSPSSAPPSTSPSPIPVTPRNRNRLLCEQSHHGLSPWWQTPRCHRRPLGCD